MTVDTTSHAGLRVLPHLHSVIGSPALDTGHMCARINAMLPENRTPYDACQVRGIHYRNPSRVLIAFELEHTSGDAETHLPAFVYLRVLTDSRFAEAESAIEQKRWVASADGPSVIACEDLQGVMYWFPNDERLDGLRRLSEPKKLQRLLYEHLGGISAETHRISDRSFRLQILRFKPERRTVARLRLRVHPRDGEGREEWMTYLSIYAPEKAAQIARQLEALGAVSRSSGRWCVPDVLGLLPDDGIVVTRELRGESLRQLVAQRDPESGRALASAGTALAHLHQQGVVAGDSYEPPAPDAMLDETTMVLNTICPSLCDRAGRIVAELRRRRQRLAAAPECFVHGDCHVGQMLIDGTRVSVLDFDRCHRGDPREDIGNLRAQLWLLAPEHEALGAEFIAGYESVSARAVDSDALRYHEAFSLFRSTTVPFGRYEVGWAERTEVILTRIEDLLG